MGEYRRELTPLHLYPWEKIRTHLSSCDKVTGTCRQRFGDFRWMYTKLLGSFNLMGKSFAVSSTCRKYCRLASSSFRSSPVLLSYWRIVSSSADAITQICMIVHTFLHHYLSLNPFTLTTISGYIIERHGATMVPFLWMEEFISHFLCTAQPEVFADSFIWGWGRRWGLFFHSS